MGIDVILFDLHHTLTAVKESIPSLVRRLCLKHGVDLNHIIDVELEDAFAASDVEIKIYQIQNNVGPHWGEAPEEWIPFNRIIFEHLGIDTLSDQLILEIFTDLKTEVQKGDYEFFRNDALETVNELHNRGYRMGICTRRTDDPHSLLERTGILDLFETVQWSGVLGYAKPSPYTLLQAAKEMGINPRKCAYVGNYVNADVEAAIRSEMKPILLTWANPEERSKASEETLVLSTPIELLQVFPSKS